MRTLKQILNKGNTVLPNLVQKIQQLQELDKLLRNFIADAELAKHCQLAQIKVRNKKTSGKGKSSNGHDDQGEKYDVDKDGQYKKQKKNQDKGNDIDSIINVEYEALLVVDNAAWATKLHYAVPEILKGAVTQPEFKNLKKIRYAVKIEDYFTASNLVGLTFVVAAKGEKSKVPLCHEKLWQEMLRNLKERRR